MLSFVNKITTILNNLIFIWYKQYSWRTLIILKWYSVRDLRWHRIFRLLTFECHSTFFYFTKVGKIKTATSEKLDLLTDTGHNFCQRRLPIFNLCPWFKWCSLLWYTSSCRIICPLLNGMSGCQPLLTPLRCIITQNCRKFGKYLYD